VKLPGALVAPSIGIFLVSTIEITAKASTGASYECLISGPP
jgi:hypothetical protein